MRAEKDLSFWCCPVTSANLHPKEWRNCTSHLPEWTITGPCEGRLGEAHPLPLSIKECLEEMWQAATLGSLLESQCVSQKSVKHRKPSEQGCWVWSGWQRRSRKRWRRTKFCHGVMRSTARPALWKGLSGLPLSLGKHVVGAQHYPGESKAEGLMRIFHRPSEIHDHVETLA